jgi:hypothetical protein
MTTEEEARQEEQAEERFRLLYGCYPEEAIRREARSLLLRLAIMGRLRFESEFGRIEPARLLRLRHEAGYNQAVPDCEVQRRILGLA